MDLYCCNFCGQEFKWKSARDRHEKEKRCPKYRLEVRDTIDFSCLRHQSQEDLCNMIVNLTGLCTLLKQKYDKLEEEVNNIKQVLVTSNPINTNSNNITNISNNNNNSNTNITNNNVVVHNYGFEDMSHISFMDKVQWAADPENGVLSYVKKKHFDPEKPANHNLKMASIKREELSVRMDGGWHRLPAKPFLSKVLVKAVDDLYSAIDWETINHDAEKYFENITENPECKQGKHTVTAMVYLVCNQKDEKMNISH